MLLSRHVALAAVVARYAFWLFDLSSVGGFCGSSESLPPDGKSHAVVRSSGWAQALECALHCASETPKNPRPTWTPNNLLFLRFLIVSPYKTPPWG